MVAIDLSMSFTAIVTTGALSGPPLAPIPPFMAPGFFGILSASTSVVVKPQYSMSPICWMSQPKAFL